MKVHIMRLFKIFIHLLSVHLLPCKWQADCLLCSWLLRYPEYYEWETATAEEHGFLRLDRRRREAVTDRKRFTTRTNQKKANAGDCHRFQTSMLLPVHTTTQPWSFQTNTAAKLQSSVDGRRERSGSDAFKNEKRTNVVIAVGCTSKAYVANMEGLNTDCHDPAAIAGNMHQ